MYHNPGFSYMLVPYGAAFLELKATGTRTQASQVGHSSSNVSSPNENTTSHQEPQLRPPPKNTQDRNSVLASTPQGLSLPSLPQNAENLSVKTLANSDSNIPWLQRLWNV
ncbi:hypothetical protein CBL_12864 [Carabus blaptoides fortunei]